MTTMIGRSSRCTRRVGAARVLTTLLAAMAWLPFAGLAGVLESATREEAAVAGAEQPTKLGLVESVGVALALLDVEVKDEHGKPSRGLVKDDFRVWLNGHEWALYSVDDLCTCEGDALSGRGVQRPQETPPLTLPSGEASAPLSATPSAGPSAPSTSPAAPSTATVTSAASRAAGVLTANAVASYLRFVLFF